MSSLHVVFDGYHLQKVFDAKVGRPVGGEDVRAIRNAIARAVRPTGTIFDRMRTTFVTGNVGPLIVDPRHRFLINRNVAALDAKKSRSIDYVFRPLVPGPAGSFVQQEHLCDEAIIDRIDAVPDRHTVAICTVDGRQMKDRSGRRVPGIADALQRAHDRKAEVWLFTFRGCGQRPGAALLRSVGENRHLACRLLTRGTEIKMRMTSGSISRWVSLSASPSMRTSAALERPMGVAA